MSVENKDNEFAEELRGIVLGYNPASLDDIAEFENTAYVLLGSAPVSSVSEVHFIVDSGAVGMVLVDESDTSEATKPAVIVSIHEDDPDEPYLLLEYDSNNLLTGSTTFGNRSAESNKNGALRVLEELSSNNSYTDSEDEEKSVFYQLAEIAGSIAGHCIKPIERKDDIPNIVDLIRKIVYMNRAGIQHAREISDIIGIGQEVTVFSSVFEPIQHREPTPINEQQPKICVQLRDATEGTQTLYIREANGSNIAEVSPLKDLDFEEDIEDREDFDEDVITESLRVLDTQKRIIDLEILGTLSSALNRLGLKIAKKR